MVPGDELESPTLGASNLRSTNWANQAYLVGEVGADPTILDASAGFTDQCSCRFATHRCMVRVIRFERTTNELKVRYSTDWVTRAYYGGKPRYRPEHLGVADHCLTSWLVYHIGTQSRSRTYVKGLEDPCTIRYTIRALWWDPSDLNWDYLVYETSARTICTKVPYLATGVGFEPTSRIQAGTLAFKATPIDHSGTLPY